MAQVQAEEVAGMEAQQQADSQLGAAAHPLVQALQLQLAAWDAPPASARLLQLLAQCPASFLRRAADGEVLLLHVLHLLHSLHAIPLGDGGAAAQGQRVRRAQCCACAAPQRLSRSKTQETRVHSGWVPARLRHFSAC